MGPFYLSLQLDRTIQSIIGLYTPIHGNTALKGFTQLYRTMQSYEKVYRAIKSRTGLYTAT